MELNITLFIQIANFVICYYVLRKVILVPAIAAINARKLHEQELLSDLAQQEEKLLVLTKKKNDALYALKNRFPSYIPDIFEEPLINLEVSYQKKPEELELAIADAKEVLIQKVPRIDTHDA